MLVTENSALETKTRHRLHYEGTGRRNNYQKKKKSRWTINKTHFCRLQTHIKQCYSETKDCLTGTKYLYNRSHIINIFFKELTFFFSRQALHIQQKEKILLAEN